MCSCSTAFNLPLILLQDGNARACGSLGISIKFVMGLPDQLCYIIQYLQKLQANLLCMNLSGSILYNNLINGFVNAFPLESFGIGWSDIIFILLCIVVYYFGGAFSFSQFLGEVVVAQMTVYLIFTQWLIQINIPFQFYFHIYWWSFDLLAVRGLCQHFC